MTAVLVRWPAMVRPFLVPLLQSLSKSACLEPPTLTVQPEATSLGSVDAPQKFCLFLPLDDPDI